MAQLPITEIVNVSVSEDQAGAGKYNVNNVAIFSEEPAAVSFGSLGYKIYLSPTEVGEDFGTASQTYAQALSIFSQQPNILNGGGYLVVIPLVTEVQSITPSAAPASGTYELNFGGDVTAAIQWNATAADIQTAVRTLTGLEDATVTGTLATAVQVSFKGYYGDAALLTVTNNTLNGSITLAIAQVTAGETLATAITRTTGLVQYFGIMGTRIFSQADMLAAAAVIQPLNKMGFFVSRTSADVNPGGMLDLLRTGGFSKSRGLLYLGADDASALGMMSAYVGRALSTAFEGSNTTQTMHMKDLTGVQPDPNMNTTILALCKTAGADVYASFQGVPKVFCTKGNTFFDRVYNLCWFVGDLQIQGFNYIAQAANKIPQTESGMDGLKGAYRVSCDTGVTNQFLAPGTWNSATTFGNQADFLANILQKGYYIYSLPISQQTQAAREDREAPLVQIAAKEAGAIHSSNVIVNINA